jgi:hypothetical protein
MFPISILVLQVVLILWFLFGGGFALVSDGRDLVEARDW